ncbi:MAG: hypothetical protein JNK49_05735 [Planctomycetes bacterium]|nr:hypothetical protein [Planctomycetota bacterium]
MRDAVAMAISGTVPSGRRVGFDPVPLARWLKRATWVLGIAATVVFFSWYGSARVPLGMNTLADVPPGAWCIVDRRASAVQPGRAVFVAVPDLGVLLSRVASIDGDTVRIEHDDPQCGWPDSRGFGAVPRAAVRSTVLVAFPPARRG